MDGFRPGFRFYPTEEEIVLFYLRNKLENTRQDMDVVIPVLDVYSFEPWQLPEQARISDEEQWFFFCPKQQREAQGGRPTRTTSSGYWKATGSLTSIYASSSNGGRGVIGTKRTMVFYNGRAPHGTKTKWKMNEYKASEHDSTGPTSRLHDEFSLCRIYINTGCLRSFDRRPPANGVPSDRQTILTAVEGSSQPTTLLDSSASGEKGPGGDDVDWMHFEDINLDFIDSI